MDGDRTKMNYLKPMSDDMTPKQYVESWKKPIKTMTYPCCSPKYASFIFVFGSNLAGRHGKGAALHALKCHGARYGGEIGYHCVEGNIYYLRSYALPTKDKNLTILPLKIVEFYIRNLKIFAVEDQQLYGKDGHKFFITRIGCGLAGYKDSQIAPLFANSPDNCYFPPEWKQYLPNKKFWGI